MFSAYFPKISRFSCAVHIDYFSSAVITLMILYSGNLVRSAQCMADETHFEPVNIVHEFRTECFCNTLEVNEYMEH